MNAIQAPTCGCGRIASKPHQFHGKPNVLIWVCSEGHSTRITYCSENTLKAIKELFSEVAA